MQPERYQQVKAIFVDLLDQPAAAREALLRARCGDDADLRRQVEALLASHDQAPDFLAQPALKVKASDLVQKPPVPRPPSGSVAADAADPNADPNATAPADDERVVGPYRLLEVLGEGGMGTVYKAEQTNPVRRLVALKLIKMGMDTREVIARFEAERQALAMMDHPCIARVLDAGATARGRPYFVMEYVPGVPINEHADRHNLNTVQRLRLFLDVCEAVHHAHQRAVIHRDLKPSNILVMFQNDRAVPKVIDFGIAKATNHHLTERTVFTEQGRIIGTPEYMSPEQAEMTEQGVDTRTDVYSLGVILYELLAGVLPFTPQELRAQGYSGLQKTIREVEPPLPSTKITTLGATVPAKIAQSRSTDLRTLVRQLRGDLDWIVMKAIAKSRTERYESAFGLSEDIRRFLHDEPVLATRPSIRYRLAKFVRRNRVAVATIAAIVLALGIGLVLALLAYREVARKESAVRAALIDAQAEKERAEAARQQAERKEAEARASEQKARENEALAQANLERATASERREESTAQEKARQVEENEALVAQAFFSELQRTADDLWPAHPAQVQALQRWIADVDAMVARLPQLRAVRDRLRQSAQPPTEAEIAADRAAYPRAEQLRVAKARLLAEGIAADERSRLEADVAQWQREADTRRTWTFATRDLALRHAVLSQLVAGLAAAAAPDGSLPQMRWRLQEASTLRARTVDTHEAAWRTAVAAVAAAPPYQAAIGKGMQLTPQVGLVPLGADPQSGLQEFAHLQSGAPPARGGDGRLVIDAESALVFVLLPGGAFQMGAVSQGSSSFDPAAFDHEAPLHEVVLQPFFISKFEMTQAQWQRWTRTNPSNYVAGQVVGGKQTITETNPVETITWTEASTVLRQLGLALPTEAQWEYAARAGKGTIWTSGDAPATLAGFANLAAADAPPDWLHESSFADGFLVHAPAAALAGNAFGLHHIPGNVSEWCRDGYGSYTNPVLGVDGLRAVPASLQRVHRGGSYRSTAGECRSTARDYSPADARSERCGVRPVRAVDVDR
jgi:serine/threonine protein kinase/formylglycine-generating enzyme required for sulfatase activity